MGGEGGGQCGCPSGCAWRERNAVRWWSSLSSAARRRWRLRSRTGSARTRAAPAPPSSLPPPSPPIRRFKGIGRRPLPRERRPPDSKYEKRVGKKKKNGPRRNPPLTPPPTCPSRHLLLPGRRTRNATLEGGGPPLPPHTPPRLFGSWTEEGCVFGCARRAACAFTPPPPTPLPHPRGRPTSLPAGAPSRARKAVRPARSPFSHCAPLRGGARGARGQQGGRQLANANGRYCYGSSSSEV